MRSSKIMIVGGTVIPNKKGEITIPPTEAIRMEMGQDCIEIPVKRGRGKDAHDGR